MPTTPLRRGKSGTRKQNAAFVELDAAIAAKQPLTGSTFAVAGLPAAASHVGRVVYCTNGSAGAACAALSIGTAWKVIALGATVSAT